MKLASAAQDADDTEAFFDAANAPVVRLIHGLNRHFERDGGTHAGAILRTGEFLRWPPNERLPHHWVSAHLFAAIAHRLSSGQRRFPSRGMLNDIKAIATYGPYVDAMFLDKECESLIRESNLARRMGLRASVFSLNNTEGFLTYLSSLIDGSSDEVVTCAREIFGDDV
jgi:hypothetical protein